LTTVHCRCVRCLGEDCVELAANILAVLTSVYDATKDPSCLYVATAMVGVRMPCLAVKSAATALYLDAQVCLIQLTTLLLHQVFGLQPSFQEPLFNLVDGLSRSTFSLLASSPDALRQNPDSVSDIFRYDVGSYSCCH